MIIFACDPGGTTGWATYNTITKGYDGGQLGPDEHHVELWELLESPPTNNFSSLYVVTESFEFRNNVETEDRRKGLNLVSKEYIGLMKLFARMHGCHYVEQMPAHAKGFITDEKLDALGLIKTPKHPNRHEHDALRHLLFFMVAKLKIKEGIVDKWKRKD